MPHICHISTTFNLRSGSAQRTSAILQGCVARGYRVSLVVGRDHDVCRENLVGVEIYRVPELVKYVSPYFDTVAPWKIRGLLKQLRPNIVHTHLAKAGIVGRFAATSCRIPIIMHTVHGPSFPARFHPAKRFLFRSLERLLGRRTDCFVFVGSELRDKFIYANICSAENSLVINTGRPDEVFERPVMSQGPKKRLRSELCGGAKPEFLLAAVGRIVPSKQLEHGVRVVAELRRQDVPVHLVLAGKCLLQEEQDYEKELQQLADRLEVGEYVHFVGFRDDVLDIMEASDAVLLTSSYEGLPNVAVEAVLAGTPMITYDVSGVREVIREGETGWVVEQGDINSVVARVCQLAAGSVLTDDVAARRRDLNSFRESVMVERKMKLYEQILQGAGQ